MAEKKSFLKKIKISKNCESQIIKIPIGKINQVALKSIKKIFK